MAMFKAFKPSGMEKIARAMGYSGNMQGFQDYLAQDPMRQHQMQTYQQKAMQMAKGGMVRKKYQEGGGVTKDGGLLGQPFQQNYQSAPMYEQFKQSDYYKNIPQIGAAVTGSSTIDGQTYNFPYASEASAYNNYMKSLGSYQVGSPLNPNAVPQQGVGKSSGTTMGGPLDGPLKFEQVAQPVSSSYGAGFRQPGDMGRYVAFNDPGQPGAGFANAAEYEAAQQQGNVLGMPYDPRFMDKFPRPTSTTDPRIIADGPGNLAQAQNQRLAPWLEGYDFFNPNKTLEERSAEIQRLEREYKAANPNWEQELRTMADDTPIPYMPQQATTPAAYQPLPQAYVPPQQFEQVEKPKMDTNQFLADGTTPNPNYMKPITDAEGNVVTEMTAPTIADISAQMMQQPGLPTGSAVTAQGIQTTPEQMIPTTTGQVSGAVAVPTAMATTTFTQGPQETQANVMQATQAAPAVNAAMNATQAAQGTVDPQAQVLAAQQTATSVGNVNAAQGNAILMDNPTQRQIQQGELISGAADAQKAAQFTEQVQAAQATPTQQATVQGQLQDLMLDFQDGATPPWASGAIRAASQAMAARGLGASSLAGQAVIQAAMESALPIAQADASIFAQFEQQNLSNRQQRAMLAAQQRAAFMGQEFDQEFQARVANSARIGDIANMNFTAEQQIALENSRIANTMNLANLSNSQAVVMAEAAALSQMDMANLSNRQQAAVMNAQNFMQMDLANLSNQQQTELFKAQQRTQALFTDQAATNAARQFNATSQNQVDQFFATLANDVAQFNATQANAQSQYNAGQRNVVERFNAELNNQRDQFNANNRLVIDQNNAQWRRQVATANTAAINRANELNASALLGMSQQAYNNMWQYYGDSMEWAWTSAENERSRVVNLAIEQLRADSNYNIQSMKEDYASSTGFGSLIGTFLTASSSSIVGKLFGF